MSSSFLDIVICGNAKQVLAEMPAMSVDLVFTSPPYPAAIKKWKNKTETARQCIERIRDMNLEIFIQCTRVLKRGGALAWEVGSIPYKAELFNNTVDILQKSPSLDLLLRSEIIWSKGVTNPLPPPGFILRPCIIHSTHEYILVFYKHERIVKEKKSSLSSEDKKWGVQSVWSIPPPINSEHPAPFPVELARRVIALHSMPGDIVLDPFCGSGTTLVAAHALGRHYVGIEIEQKWVEHSRKRLAERGDEVAYEVLGAEEKPLIVQSALWQGGLPIEKAKERRARRKKCL